MATLAMMTMMACSLTLKGPGLREKSSGNPSLLRTFQLGR